eukprot:scaffold262083_cov26-Tisochrysis_lutea.AAC.2
MGLAALLLIAACGMKGSSRLGVRDASSRSRHAPALLAVDTPLSSRHSRKISLPANADEKTLKKAFKQLAIELHPDISGGDAEAAAKFAEISAEYSRLLKQARKDQSFHSPNRVLAMVALAAAALYGTTEDPVLPVVLFAAGSWISTILTEERKPPRQLTMARDLLAQGVSLAWRFVAPLPRRECSYHVGGLTSSPPHQLCRAKILALQVEAPALALYP